MDETVQFLYNDSVMPLYEYSCKKCGKRFECLVTAGKERTSSAPSADRPTSGR